MRDRFRLTRAAYVEGILNGNRAVLSQAITLIESSLASDTELAEDVLDDCLPRTGSSIRVGITGVPGVGKSSVIEALGTHLTRDLNETVAVLAIDPSSQVSGGSILGDKTRMQELANDERAFVRPSPSGGMLGGVGRHTRQAMLLCEAAGYANILVETAGVGQSETTVHSMVDFFLLLMLTGAGDELQAMKRGIMELADLLAINKADRGNKQAAEAACHELENHWGPRVVTCSAHTGEGIPEIWYRISEHRDMAQANGSFQQRRKLQLKSSMHDAIEEGLRQHFYANAQVRQELLLLEHDVLEGRITSFRAAHRLLNLYKIKTR